MTIKYSPPNLKHVFSHPYGDKMLRNRFGCVQEMFPDGRGVCLGEGPISIVYEAALLLERERPRATFLVSEDRCGGVCPAEFR